MNYYDIYQGTKNLKNWCGCVRADSEDEAVTKAEKKFHRPLLIAVFRCEVGTVSLTNPTTWPFPITSEKKG